MIDSITLKDIPRRIKASVVLMAIAVAVLQNLYGWHQGVFVGREPLHLVGMVLGCTAMVMVLHEGLHGLAFRLFGADVSFGVKWRSKYGPLFWTLSSRLLSRMRSQIVALSPQILSIGLLVAVASGGLSAIGSWLCLLGAGMNLCGGCFDMYVARRLGRFPRACLVKDTIDGVQVFAPGYQT